MVPSCPTPNVDAVTFPKEMRPPPTVCTWVSRLSLFKAVSRRAIKIPFPAFFLILCSSGISARLYLGNTTGMTYAATSFGETSDSLVCKGLIPRFDRG